MVTIAASVVESWVAVLAVAALVVAGVIMVRTYLAARRLRRHLVRYLKGDFEPTLREGGPLGVDGVADAVERLVARLRENLLRESQQHHELETVLRSMAEGVLVVDARQQIVRINPAAARLLGLDPRTCLGRTVAEAARHAGLLQLVRRALDSDEPAVADLIVHGGLDEANDDASPELMLQGQGMSLRDAPGQRVGAVIVLHDVTRLRQLERVRRDFVANVSHELRTPVTAIKGFSETLADADAMDAADTQRFLKIIAHQADRLTQLVDDLLSLARIEQAAERYRVVLEPGDLSEVVREAVESCRLSAAEKRITIALDCPENLVASMNAALLEQALANLLDNAIKYSGVETHIEVKVTREEGGFCVAVHDQGPGIDARHLPRLFERFYRVDRARSRSVGGTGLGLAIVKHVARAHGGEVSVESTVGRGSIFRIHLPLKPAAPLAAGMG